jgi:uncharacterized protein YciI
MVRVGLLALLFLPALRAEVYCFGFLNAHPDRKEIPQDEAMAIQKAHLAHMEKMGLEGRLLAAGPMATQGGPRGIVLYRCKSVEEAEGWTALDPAVSGKRLTTEFYLWRARDGFGEPLMTKLKSDPATKYAMVQLPLILFKKTGTWVGQGPAEILKEHGGAVTGLLKDGTLRAAGPFVDGEGRYGLVPGAVGLYVFSAMPLDQAKAVAEKDPMVREGFATVQAMMWFVADDVVPKAANAGSAAPR